MEVGFTEVDPNQPVMTAEACTDGKALSDPEFQGGSGIGVVLVEFKPPQHGSVKQNVLIAKSSRIKKGDNVSLELAFFYPVGPGVRLECMVAVPKKK